MSDVLPTGSLCGRVRVFVSYDPEHDEDLLDRLVEEAAKASSTFEITARSVRGLGKQAVQRAIREAEQVVVLCSPDTEGPGSVSDELAIAQEEGRPYTLVWGRREQMCKKPAAAKPADTMYSCDPTFLHTQILALRRSADSSRKAVHLRRNVAPPKP